MKPTPEQRAAWLAGAEERAGTTRAGWFQDLEAAKPSTVDCDAAEFFETCRMANAGRLTIYGAKADGARWILSIGWPEPKALAQAEMIL